MSETKRATSDYQHGRAAGTPPEPDIEHSQPRQTLEVQRMHALLQSERSGGGDPYNSVGAKVFRHRAA